MSLDEQFGPFARVFEKGELEVPGHLELLSLTSAGAQIPSGLSAAERHSATGPGGQSHRSAKMFASMLAMCKELADLASWSVRVQQDERAKEMLANDAAWDNSESIVVSWLAALRSLFRARGVTLRLVE